MRRVVVTGMGAITPLGMDLPSTWRALLAGESGVGPIARFNATDFPVRFAAEVDLPDAHDEGQLKLDLTARALNEALAGQGLPDLDPRRLGVCFGSEAARPTLEVVASRMRTGHIPGAEELMRNAPAAPTQYVAERIGAQGPCWTLSTACTSSSQAVGEGMLHIRRGDVDAMVVGGVDVLVNPVMVTGFSLLGALSSRNENPQGASRPFDLNRDGFVLGEGAGVLILESLESAQARGAEILAELRGYGASLNAYRITDSPPDGRGAAQAMKNALKDGRLNAEQVGYINAHGTSTPMNDASESRGILKVFGEDTRPAVSSTKSMMGHLVAACGAVEAIVAAMATRHGMLPPTINLDNPDPACALDHVAHFAREQQTRHALTNAFGFGGSNGSLLLSRWEG